MIATFASTLTRIPRHLRIAREDALGDERAKPMCLCIASMMGVDAVPESAGRLGHRQGPTDYAPLLCSSRTIDLTASMRPSSSMTLLFVL